VSDFLLPERPVNERAAALGLEGMDATFGQGFGAVFDDSMVRNPLPSLSRMADRLQYYPSTDEFGNEMPARTPSKMLTPDEANAKYGVPGKLKFDADTPEPIAEELRALKVKELERQDTMRRAQSGLGTQLTAGLVASILDPLNVGLAFIPVVGQARFATMAARVGVPGARIATGAIEGAAGAALLEPLVLAAATQEQADYDITDSLANVAFGGILGSGLHLAGGAVGDRLAARREASTFQRTVDDLPRADQEALARAAIAQVVEGRPVDVGPVLDASPKVAEIRQQAEVERRVEEAQEAGVPVDLGDGAPPLAPDTVRLYHGGEPPEGVDMPLWVTRSLNDAQGWAARGEGMRVWYVDVPADNPAIRKYAGDLPNGIAPITRFELPPDVARGRAAIDPQQMAERAAEVAETQGVAADKVQVAERIRAEPVRYADPEDAAAADTTTRRVDAERTVGGKVADDVKWAEEELAYLDTLTPEDRDRLATTPAEKEANTYAKAWREAAACAVRKG